MSVTAIRHEVLSPGAKNVLAAVLADVERRLIQSWDELNAGVNTSEAAGSISFTLQVKAGKRGRFSGKVTSRVRTPTEPTEFDMHIGDDRQLSLGLPADYNDEPPNVDGPDD